ncbi:dTMP kinase [Altererythrobacter insulae]|nr:dTMP kinase [Altererythrobacter insulae]
MDFFMRVHDKYRELAAQDTTIITVDAAQPMLKVHQDIATTVSEFIAKATVD